VFAPGIIMIHLDDWDMQQRYGKNAPRETRDFLWSRGIRHYLRVPNEEKHSINARLGMAEIVKDASLATEEFRSGENVLYALVPPPDADGEGADAPLQMEIQPPTKQPNER